MFEASRAAASWSRFRRSQQFVPVLVIVAVFAVSRVAARAAGLRFDTSPLTHFWQIADTNLLHHDLLSTLWNLHSQPPLYNLWLGLNLKLFSSHVGFATHVEYLAGGLVLALLLYALLLRITGRRAVALILACGFTASPAVLLYEDWLFYEYPVTILLIAALYALDRFARSPTTARGTVFFTLVAMLIYTRSTFQLPWAILAVAVLLWALPAARRAVLVSCAVPMLAVVLLYVKNEVVFGVPSTSSWAGMNLAEVAYAKLSPATRAHLIADGTLSKTAAIAPFSTLDRYPDFVASTRKTGIPILDETIANGANNYNNLAYIEISNRYFHDALALIRARPGVYLSGVGVGLRRFSEPASNDGYLTAGNIIAIRHWDAWFSDVVLIRIWTISHTAWGIVLGYIAALAYGLVLLRRRGRDDRQPLLALAWMTLAYATLVITFGEEADNQRLRFCLDPVALLLLASAGRDAVLRLRRK